MKFEVVVANPPFSLDKWGQETASADPFERFDRGVPPKSKGDFAFTLHMIANMTEDSGRAVWLYRMACDFAAAVKARFGRS